MTEIVNSLLNGQYKQVIKQISEAGMPLSQFIEEVQRREYINPNEIVRVMKVAESVGYITYDSKIAKDLK